ncbi:hypothetical protein T10_12706 [Trichinella papuae]|uniref:Uncharacterized protein n=1 Tax=Trichinella papuae TaxID=268474 RepID=A0A0V1LZ40_9BILA|nr:hypothetical protein T10_12706 [Trichinella papuae]
MQTSGRTPEQRLGADNNEERSHNVIITTSNQHEQETSQEQELSRPKRIPNHPKMAEGLCHGSLTNNHSRGATYRRRSNSAEL